MKKAMEVKKKIWQYIDRSQDDHVIYRKRPDLNFCMEHLIP